MPRLDPILERWLLVAGWSAIVILWHTTLAAVGLAAWRAWRSRASAQAQYRAALVAFVACAALAAATPLGLLSVRVDRVIGQAVPMPASAAVLRRSAAIAPPPVPLVHSVPARSAAVWLGGLWLAGSLIALVRLAGGWALSRWIRRRATAIGSTDVVDRVRGSGEPWPLPDAALFASAHVEAPVVLGHRAPAILLPSAVAGQLAPDTMAPLIAHEFAHVARADYAVNLAQSIVEAVLVLSPGVHWIARRIREAREYCCDDLVAARCGAHAYARALTAVAGLGAAPRARPALNVAGPRLIVRIRRLLEEDTMTPFRTARFTALVALLVLAVAAGGELLPLSAAAIAQGPALTPDGIPLAFPPQQDGSAVDLQSFESTEHAVCGTASIRNRADVGLVSVRFAAVLSAFGEPGPLRVSFSEEIPVDVASDASARVSADLLEPRDLPRRPVLGQVQATCMLAQARFANGHVWGIDPVTARAIDIRIRFPKADVPRSVLGAASASGSTSFCLDDSGRTFSLDAIVAVRNEPGRFAKCVDGRWDGR